MGVEIDGNKQNIYGLIDDMQTYLKKRPALKKDKRALINGWLKRLKAIHRNME